LNDERILAGDAPRSVTGAATGIAFVGCGYVADLYLRTLDNRAGSLALKGVWDVRPDRLQCFTDHYGLHRYTGLDDLLADPAVDIVVNLTNPAQHFDVSQQILAAGKHVYSEKPLALHLDEAEKLIALAGHAGLHIVAAPSTVLGSAAQTIMKAVREEVRGKPRLVYAELDDGMVYKIGCEGWITETGAAWPATDEFATGCTLEHAGYALSWLVAMFGPVRRMVSLAALTVPDKGRATPANLSTPDFTCTVLEMDNGVIARLTNSIVAPHDHRFRVFCDDGWLGIKEVWDFAAPVRSVPLATTRLRRQLEKQLHWDGGRTLTPVAARKMKSARRGFPMDFTLGVAEMASAIRAGQVPRLAGEFSLHITEVSLAIQHPERFGCEYHPRSAPGPVAPMPDVP
jgi:predicted dehydrogenase